MELSSRSMQGNSKGVLTGSNRCRSVFVLVLLLVAALLAGCHGDPNVRKQRYLESGKRYSAQSKYREAAIQFSSALKVDKSDPETHYELAQAYLHLGQFGPAYGELSRTVELQPRNSKARIDLGNLLVAAGKIDDAQKQAEAVLAAQPNNPDAYAMLSAIAVRRGEKDQALIEINRALELDPNRAAFHANLALLQVGDITKTATVENELKKSIALDPQSVNAKLALASFYARDGRWQEAERWGRDAVATDPKNVWVHGTLAQIYLKQGNQMKAEEVLRSARTDLADYPHAVRMLTDYYISSGQIDKAKAEFANFAAKYPKQTSVQKGYVRVLLQLKDYATARTIVSRLMKNNPKDPEVAALNGIVLLSDGKANDAVNALMNGVRNFPKDAFMQFWLGEAALAKGDNALAEKSFRQAADLNPSAFDALQELALIASQRGDMDLLADVADKAINAAPRTAAGYVWRATVELRRNAADKAEADLKTAISIAPQSPEAYLQLGKLRLIQRRFPEGVLLLEQALQYDPNSIAALRLILSYDLYQGKPDKALARLNEQIAKIPANSSLYDLLAQFQIQGKNLEQASASAQKAIQLNPDDGDAVLLLGQIQVQRGQVANAIGAWEQWRIAHPNDAGALAILGTLEELHGDFGKAEEYYKKSLQIRPQQPIAANNLAYRMIQKGENLDVALSLAQTARQGMPNSPNAADTLAWAYYHKGTYAFARNLLEDAVKTEPNNATIQYHLGMVYSRLQDKNNATIHLKKAASLAPPNSLAAKDARVALKGLG